MKKALLLGVGIVALSLGGCSTDTTVAELRKENRELKEQISNMDTAGNTYQDTEVQTETEAALSNSKIGESVEFTSGVKVTIDSVNESSDTPNGDINGNFIEVAFTIDNQSDSDFYFNAHKVELYDSDRNKAELDSKDYYSENIAKGMKASGKAFFDSKEKGPFYVKVGDSIWESK